MMCISEGNACGCVSQLVVGTIFRADADMLMLAGLMRMHAKFEVPGPL